MLVEPDGFAWCTADDSVRAQVSVSLSKPVEVCSEAERAPSANNPLHPLHHLLVEVVDCLVRNLRLLPPAACSDNRPHRHCSARNRLNRSSSSSHCSNSSNNPSSSSLGPYLAAEVCSDRRLAAVLRPIRKLSNLTHTLPQMLLMRTAQTHCFSQLRLRPLGLRQRTRRSHRFLPRSAGHLARHRKSPGCVDSADRPRLPGRLQGARCLSARALARAPTGVLHRRTERERRLYV